MIGDPYEEADARHRVDEARLVKPAPAKKSRKIVFAGIALTCIILGAVILANIAALVTSRVSPDPRQMPKPTTMTKNQSDGFAAQQSGEAAYIKGLDRDKTLQNNENTVMGQSGNLASDAFAEADGVQKKTKAQDDAEHGRNVSRADAKSEAQQQRERAALEEQHRRQNDLDSSPISLDFSDYFEKEKAPAVQTLGNDRTAAATRTGADLPVEQEAFRRRRSALADVLNGDVELAEVQTPKTSFRGWMWSDKQACVIW